MVETLTAPSFETIRMVEAALQHSVGEIAVAPSVNRANKIIVDTDDILFAKGLWSKPHHTDELIDVWMGDDPGAAFVAELGFLADKLYVDRTFSRTDGRLRTDEFVTGVHQNGTADASYRLIRASDGTATAATVRTHLNRFDSPVIIRYVAGRSDLQVTAEKSNGWQETPLPTAKGERGDIMQRAFFASTIWASRLALKRGQVEQTNVNNQAAQTMQCQVAQRRGVYITAAMYQQ